MVSTENDFRAARGLECRIKLNICLAVKEIAAKEAWHIKRGNRAKANYHLSASFYNLKSALGVLGTRAPTAMPVLQPRIRNRESESRPTTEAARWLPSKCNVSEQLGLGHARGGAHGNVERQYRQAAIDPVLHKLCSVPVMSVLRKS